MGQSSSIIKENFFLELLFFKKHCDVRPCLSTYIIYKGKKNLKFEYQVIENLSEKNLGWSNREVLAQNKDRAAIKLNSFEITKIDPKTGIPSKSIESDFFIVFENLDEVEQFV